MTQSGELSPSDWNKVQTLIQEHLLLDRRHDEAFLLPRDSYVSDGHRMIHGEPPPFGPCSPCGGESTWLFGEFLAVAKRSPHQGTSQVLGGGARNPKLPWMLSGRNSKHHHGREWDTRRSNDYFYTPASKKLQR